ncbi:hypothetical protein NXC14_CH03208 [Rhizobium sp. NXC14]|nr:hypothetical protein NXC14_CH03208 [Rhizobium sp. NXC14]
MISAQQGAVWPRNVLFAPVRTGNFAVFALCMHIFERQQGGPHEYFAHYALSRRDADQGDMAPLERASF